jgi:hypothetical protein
LSFFIAKYFTLKQSTTGFVLSYLLLQLNSIANLYKASDSSLQ